MATITVRGVRLNVLTFDNGASDRLPILLLHPNQMVAYIWNWMREASHTATQWIMPNQRGHGDSAYPPADGADQPYALDEYAADAVALLDALGIGRAVVVGAATGGNVSLLLASAHPERVAGLVVINPALSLTAERVAQMQTMMRGGVYASLVEAAAALPHTQRWTDEQRLKYAYFAFRRKGESEWEWRVSHDAVMATYESVAVSIWDRIRVSCPTLLIRSDASPVYSADDERRLRAAIPPAETRLIADAGQLVMMDKPAEVAAALDAFVDRLA